MNLTMFENLNGRGISPEEAKRILNRNGNAFSDEEVAKIIDFLYDFAEVSVEHLENQNRKRVHGFARNSTLELS
jgi:hypothetical protein